MTKAEKRIEWKARFDVWKVSGLMVAEWCREEGVEAYFSLTSVPILIFSGRMQGTSY